MRFTKEQIEKGFEEWAVQYRKDPSHFLNPEELTVEDYGKDCADYLVELIESLIKKE